jgi:hypothetical protein
MALLVVEKEVILPLGDGEVNLILCHRYLSSLALVCTGNISCGGGLTDTSNPGTSHPISAVYLRVPWGATSTYKSSFHPLSSNYVGGNQAPASPRCPV